VFDVAARGKQYRLALNAESVNAAPLTMFDLPKAIILARRRDAAPVIAAVRVSTKPKEAGLPVRPMIRCPKKTAS